MTGVTTWALLLGAGVVCWLAARNVFSEDDATVELAREVACHGVTCTAELEWRSRLPWGQRLSFMVDGGGRSEVWCQRALWIWGPAQCESVEVDGR